MKKDLIRYWKNYGVIRDKGLLQAFEDVPRENFVPEKFADQAYIDSPLPIAGGQTISQPSAVMVMTEQLKVKTGQKILEVGTGSGYQAAILSKLVGSKGRVVSTEIVPELVDFARKNLERSGIENVEVIEHDGSLGYEKEAPYDRIIITAACPKIPEPLIKQLKNGGILLGPVGPIFRGQEMIRITKKADELKEEILGEFLFVPLRGRHGFKGK
ncbi:TPA: protein-L-isoaspartate(D-aspartate) O-methyltransferase [archaeon]|nr:protein-L-isoaspartate(D-aspartate) O-methyltransferase [Candidatus Undinarchaeales archaeon SRR5007147.bin71]